MVFCGTLVLHFWYASGGPLLFDICVLFRLLCFEQHNRSLIGIVTIPYAPTQCDPPDKFSCTSLSDLKI